MTLRKEFELLPEDEAFLNDYGLDWETVTDGSQWVLIKNFPTPEGYNHPTITVAIRLETGYPNVALDMVYFSPALKRQDGQAIAATDGTQVIKSETYQRWSRHRTPENPWVVGRDSLGSHVILIEDWLDREFE